MWIERTPTDACADGACVSCRSFAFTSSRTLRTAGTHSLPTSASASDRQCLVRSRDFKLCGLLRHFITRTPQLHKSVPICEITIWNKGDTTWFLSTNELKTGGCISPSEDSIICCKFNNIHCWQKEWSIPDADGCAVVCKIILRDHTIIVICTYDNEIPFLFDNVYKY